MEVIKSYVSRLARELYLGLLRIRKQDNYNAIHDKHKRQLGVCSPCKTKCSKLERHIMTPHTTIKTVWLSNLKSCVSRMILIPGDWSPEGIPEDSVHRQHQS